MFTVLEYMFMVNELMFTARKHNFLRCKKYIFSLILPNKTAVMNNALVGIRVDKPNSFSVITKPSLLGVEI